MINTTFIFNAYGVSGLSEITDFPKFFDFLKEKYDTDDILNFIYELVDTNEVNSSFLKFYNNIPKDIRDKMNDDMDITETVNNINDGHIGLVMKEMEKQTVFLITKIKEFISKYKVKLSLYEKGQQMLDSYDEEDFQKLKKEIEKSDKKEILDGAKVLFQKPNLKLQIEYFKVETNSVKEEVVRWENEIKRVIDGVMSVECIDELIKIETDAELIDILLEKRQKLKKVKTLFDKIMKKY